MVGCKYYFLDTANSGVNVGPALKQTSYTAAKTATGFDTPRNLSTVVGTAQVSATLIDLAASTYGHFRTFVTPLLAAQTLQAQTITVALAGLCATGAVVKFGWGLYVWRDGVNVATIAANQLDGSAFDTAEEGRVDTDTSVEVNLLNGDRLALEVWGYNLGALSYSPNIYLGGTVEPEDQVVVASSASYVNFGTDTIQEVAPVYITSLAEVKTYLKITATTYDSFLSSLIEIAQDKIQTYCNRKIVKTLVTGELHDGDGTSKVFLDYAPIYSVVSLYDDPERDYTSGTLISSSDYLNYSRAGYLELIDSNFNQDLQNIKVTYYAGWDIVPRAIAQVALEMVARIYNESNQGKGELDITSRADGTKSISLVDKEFSPQHKIVLDSYRIERII